MIVREILDNPEMADNFDFFNDYENTRWWLVVVKDNTPERAEEAKALIERLDAGNKKYQEEFWKRLRRLKPRKTRIYRP